LQPQVSSFNTVGLDSDQGSLLVEAGRCARKGEGNYQSKQREDRTLNRAQARSLTIRLP